MRFVSYQEINIILPSGNKIKIRSPFFVKAKSKTGKKKRGPQGRGHHLGLELFGFVNKIAPTLVKEVVQLAVLAPSFDIVSRLLEDKKIKLSKNQIRKLCYTLGSIEQKSKVKMTLREGESLAGKRVFITVDGGRVRSRKQKKGPIAQEKKQHGYSTDWKEPKLFAIYVLDSKGNLNKKIPPFIDGTIDGSKEKKYESMIDLLQTYLQTLEIHKAKEVILSADGAPWIWTHVPALLKRLGVEKKKIVEVLDWTHAKQNLFPLFTDLSKKMKKKVSLSLKNAKSLLFNGEIEKLMEKVLLLSDDKAEKKMQEYFLNNKHRFQYSSFKANKIPTGSGHIESAIRRVINLRIKSPGSFWKLKNAQAVLFLRAILLYGRWLTFIKNYFSLLIKEFKTITVSPKKGKKTKELDIFSQTFHREHREQNNLSQKVTRVTEEAVKALKDAA